jgi:hypothetical protein
MLAYISDNLYISQNQSRRNWLSCQKIKNICQMQGKFKRINTEALNRSKAINYTRAWTKLCDYKQSHKNVLHLTIRLLVGCNFLNSNYPDHNAQSLKCDHLNSCVGMYSNETWSCNYLYNQPTSQLLWIRQSLIKSKRHTKILLDPEVHCRFRKSSPQDSTLT